MEVIPKSILRCVRNGCDQKPTVVLVGQHKRPDYQIQIRACDEDVPVARGVAKEKFPKVSFKEEVKPRWLLQAQEREEGAKE
jgi:hypothetical protein